MWRGHLISVPRDIGWDSSPGTEGSPLKMVHPHDWPVVLAGEWVLSEGRQSGLPFFFMWPRLGSVDAWFREGASKTTLTEKASSLVQTRIELPFCITLASVPLAKAGHTAKPRPHAGRDTPQGHDGWEAWKLKML